MIQLLCDGTACGLLIQDGTERYDVALLPRRDAPTGQVLNGARFNFHPACYTAAGAVTPAVGVSVTVSRIGATTPPPPPIDPAATLPAPMKAPAE